MDIPDKAKEALQGHEEHRVFVEVFTATWKPRDDASVYCETCKRMIYEKKEKSLED